MVSSEKKLLLLGSDVDTPYVIDYCRQQNIHTIITDYWTLEKNPAKKLADEYWMISLEDMDTLEARCISEGINGIYAGVNEYGLSRARLLTKRLGLPFYASEKSWMCSMDKLHFNRVCSEAGMEVPKIYSCDNISRSEREAIEFPVIVKPNNSCRSEGITICRNKSELKSAYAYACSASKDNNAFIQQYIEGEEYSVFLYLHNGEACIIDLLTGISFKKVCDMEKSFCQYHRKEDALYFADRMLPKIQTLFQYMDYREGPATLQFIRKGEHFYPVEMNARLEGACCWALTKPLCGFSALESLVNYQMGQEIQNFGHGILDSERSEKAITYFIFARPGTISKIDSRAVRAMKNIEVVLERYKPGDIIERTNSLVQIPWFIHVLGKDYDELCAGIKKIDDELILQDENGRNLLYPFEDFDELRSHIARIELVD